MASRKGLTGEATDDAAIAATVLHARSTLITRDQRALVTNGRMRVSYDFLD